MDPPNNSREYAMGGSILVVEDEAAIRDLLAGIKAVMRRRAPQLADDVVDIAGLRIDPAAHQVSAGDRPIDLWTTELRLLHFFMTHPGRVFSRARLLDEVWGEHVFVEERTVDVHIRQYIQLAAARPHFLQVGFQLVE